MVCCLSDPLQLSESWRNHYIWEVRSANQWDALKTAILGIGQQNSPSFSARQCLNAHCTTSASKVEWIGLWSLASSTMLTWPVTNQLPLLQESTMFCRENAFTTSRRQKRVWWISKHRVYAPGITQLIFYWQKCVDYNGSYLLNKYVL